MTQRKVLLDLEGELWTLTFFPTANLLQIEVGGHRTSFHPGLADQDEWDEEQWEVYQQYQETFEGWLRAELVHAFEGLNVIAPVDEFAVHLVFGQPLAPAYQVMGSTTTD